MTYKQAAALNAQVRRGEHGALVVYADRFTRIEADDQGEDVEREIPFMKAYTVFNNVEQIEGLPDHYTDRPEPKGEPPNLSRLPNCTTIDYASLLAVLPPCYFRPG